MRFTGSEEIISVEVQPPELRTLLKSTIIHLFYMYRFIYYLTTHFSHYNNNLIPPFRPTTSSLPHYCFVFVFSIFHLFVFSHLCYCRLITLHSCGVTKQNYHLALMWNFTNTITVTSTKIQPNLNVVCNVGL